MNEVRWQILLTPFFLSSSLNATVKKKLFKSVHICQSYCKQKILDCNQSNYSSRIVFSHIPIEFGQTGISAIQSADLENPTVEPNLLECQIW